MIEPVASYIIPGGGSSHSDYIVYVDESGDHSLTSINPRYPLFVLSFCVFRKSVYNEQVAPALRRLKFAAFGHDMVVLHESDMRRRRGAFAHLMQAPREQFLQLRGLQHRMLQWGPVEAPPVFLLHGFQDCADTFQFFV